MSVAPWRICAARFVKREKNSAKSEMVISANGSPNLSAVFLWMCLYALIFPSAI